MLENDENKAFDAALRWLRNHDAVMVSLPDAEKSIVPEFGLSRFEMAAAHLGFAVKILRQGEGEYLHCSALDDLDSYPINASMPEKLPPPRAFRYGSVIGFLGTLGLPAERFSYDKYIEKLKRKAFRNAASNFICDGFD